jgi:hypothetical protein
VGRQKSFALVEMMTEAVNFLTIVYLEKVVWMEASVKEFVLYLAKIMK